MNWTTRNIRFGLNYTPSKKWYYIWNEWDLNEIKNDFKAMSKIGIDHIRIQLIWPYFQPNPRYISQTHLRYLHELLDISNDFGFDVLITMLTGFLSGYFFLPPSVNRQDIFKKQSTIDMEKYFINTIITECTKHNNVIGFDLGNEINCNDHSLEPSIGDKWAKEMISLIKNVDPNARVVNGVDHSPLLLGSTFSLPHLAQDYDYITIHSWPFFSGCLVDENIDGMSSILLSQFYSEYMRAFTNKEIPIWIQEFGACDLWGSEAAIEHYMRKSIQCAIKSGVSNFTWWCSHDKLKYLQFEESEYYYGLFKPDNSMKPIGSVYKEIIEEWTTKILPNPEYDKIIVLNDEFVPKQKGTTGKHWTEDMRLSNVWGIYKLYQNLIKEGYNPKLVLKRNLQAEDHSKVCYVN